LIPLGLSIRRTYFRSKARLMAACPKQYDFKAEDGSELLASVEAFTKWWIAWRTHALKRYELTPEEYRGLGKVNEHKGVVVGELAGWMRLSDSQAGRVLREWEEKKSWVKIERSGKDERKKIVQLTARGEEMLAGCKQQLEDLMRRLLQRVQKKQQRQILGGVKLLKQITQNWATVLQDGFTINDQMIGLLEDEDTPRRKKRKLRASRKGKGQAVMTGAAAVEVKTGAA
jgi:DNA-binding MarR family transcriptional regulator